jgi:stage V sporulation protein B
MKKQRSFFFNTVVLTATSQSLRIAGLFVISFLSVRIGTEGIGLYQLIGSMYILIATLATSGIGLSITRLIAESAAKSGRTTTSNVLRRGVIYSLILSSAVAVLVYLSADFLGNAILNDARTVTSLRILAPGLPFMAVTSCLRGYFIGLRNALKPASEMLLDQTISIVFIVTVLPFFIPQGLEAACFALFFAGSASEVVTCLYAYILYRIERRKIGLKVVKDPHIRKKILGIAVPVALTYNLRAGLRTAENVLIPHSLRRFGASQSESLSQYGLLIGMVMPVLTFPSAFLSALSTLLIPEVSEAYALKDMERVSRMVSRVFRLTLLLSLLFSGIFVFFARELGSLLYQSTQAGSFLRLLAPLIPMIYLDFLVDGMLNGLNQQKRTLRINIMDYTVRITLILLLVPRFGLMAFICIYYFSTVFNSFLSIHSLVTVSGMQIRPFNWIIKPLVCVLLAASLTRIVFTLMPGGSTVVAVTLGISLTSVLYVAFLYLTRVLSRQDTRWFLRQMRAGRTKDTRPDAPLEFE